MFRTQMFPDPIMEEKMKRFALILVLGSGLGLAGCTTMNSTTRGAIVGAGAGAAVGAVATGTGTGALVGAGIGAATGAVIGANR
jgi:hypothetical protein